MSSAERAEAFLSEWLGKAWVIFPGEEEACRGALADALEAYAREEVRRALEEAAREVESTPVVVTDRIADRIRALAARHDAPAQPGRFARRDHDFKARDETPPTLGGS